MEFLVRFKIDVPTSMPADEVKALREREREHGRRLWQQGLMRRIWRVPGRRDAYALYEFPDATALHAALESLPLYPYMDIHVEPLARHPFEVEMEQEKASGAEE